MDIIKQIEYTLSKADGHEYNCKVILSINDCQVDPITFDDVLKFGIKKLSAYDYLDAAEQHSESFNIELSKLPNEILQCVKSNIIATRPTSSNKSIVKIDESVISIMRECYAEATSRARKSRENEASRQLNKAYSLSKKYNYGQFGLIKDRRDINDSDVAAIRAAEEIIRLYIWIKNKSPTRDDVKKYILKYFLKR